MFLPFIPLLFFVFSPFFLENYRNLKKINFLEKSEQEKKNCPKNIKDFFESSYIKSCIPPDSDHRGLDDDGAHQIIKLFFE